jgi:hypothetical protein
MLIFSEPYNGFREIYQEHLCTGSSITGKKLQCYSLSSHVVDLYRSSLPGIQVAISGCEGGKSATITCALGYCSMEVPSGVCMITAELPGRCFTRVLA